MRAVTGLLTVLALYAAPAHAAGVDPIAAMIDAGDPFAVADRLKAPDHLPEPERALLEGAAAAMRFDDQAAVAALERATQSAQLRPALRRLAQTLLGGVHLRAHNYAAAADALGTAYALAVAEAALTAEERLALKQTRDVAIALLGEAPQSRDALREGSVPIKRDAANLARAGGRANGIDEEFVLDTGAGYSTVTRSAAARLRLRMLPDQVVVESATADSVPARLGIAQDLEIAGNRFHSVVFLVMVDAALTFSNGAYKIDAILGFPVLSRLGRIEFVREGDGETFRAGVASGPVAPVGDLYLDGMRPIAALEFAGAGRVRLFLDSGAKATSLNAAFASAFPAVMRNAATKKMTFGGAGGSRTRNVRILSNATLVADGRARRLASVTVSDETKNEYGTLGQDVLRADGGFALDFSAMDFVFLPAK